MRNIIKEVSTVFALGIKRAFPTLENVAVVLATTKNPQFGDYQCNNAMGICKALAGTPHAVKNPQAVAQAILEHLPESPLISKTSIAGPGFINISISRDWISNELAQIVSTGITPPNVERKKVIVDFSSPNIAKEMHVGHLRSTIIGEFICRLLEFCNFEVDRVNHVGDWGTQFGMLIAYLKAEYPNFVDNPPNIGDLQAFYKLSKQRFDSDPEFKETSRLEVVKLQSGDEQNRIAWQMFCDISRREFEKIYQRLNVSLRECGESFYNPIIPGVIQSLKEKGIVQESEGAQCIFVPGHKVPLMAQKSDGGFSYDSTDLAALWHRLYELNGQWLIYVVDVGQGIHFDMVFAAGKMAGWLDEKPARLDHVGFGLVLGPDGKKFKTRSGETVRLVDLLDEAVARAAGKLREIEAERKAEAEKNGETFEPMTEEEINHNAVCIGHSAIKYADLKSNRLTDYRFSYDNMLQLKGNTAVYMMYAYARIRSIIRKANVDIDAIRTTTPISVEHNGELQLAFMLLRFPEVVENILDNLCPHFLCEYLYDLAGKFNEFFRDCRVVGDEKQNSRLLLCEATAQVMRKSFEILGIQYLERI